MAEQGEHTHVKRGKNGAILASRNKEAANLAAKEMEQRIRNLGMAGISTVQTLAKALDKHPTQVQRIITRLKQINGK